MDINKIKQKKESRMIRFLKAYCNNLAPILLCFIFVVLGFHSLFSIVIFLIHGNFWHFIANVLLWVGFKTYCDGDY